MMDHSQELPAAANSAALSSKARSSEPRAANVVAATASATWPLRATPGSFR